MDAEKLSFVPMGVTAPPSSETKYSTPLEQKESGIWDADSKFKNILISFSRIADREGEEEEGITDSAKYCVEKRDQTHL